jgi:RNA polymerase sigma-70 factor (ECF subfamily)
VDSRNDAIPAAVSRGHDREIEEAFRQNYGRLARVIARVVGDRPRAEEIAVDAFLKWWRQTGARGAGAGKWLYRVAVRLAIDELRRDARRARYVRSAPVANPPATPEDVTALGDEQRRVRAVLATLSRRDAALLLLRSEGLAYQELAAALGLNPASVGTLISRAQRAFRTEYVRRYGPAHPRD